MIMAKYTVKMSCGHEQEVELFGKYSERRKKIDFFENSGLCKECYKKKMQEKQESETFSFHVSVSTDIDEEDGSILLNVWFEGNMKPHKDEIKSIGGYRWGERQSAADFFSEKMSPLCWTKTIKRSELEKEVAMASKIGANTKKLLDDSDFFETSNYQIAVERQKKWKEKEDKIESIEKPEVPDILAGHRWNYNIYGRKGNYSIYLDGEKISISDQKAEEIADYLIKNEEYKKKVEEIKNAH